MARKTRASNVSPRQFCEFVQATTANGRGVPPLRHVTFWMGAGFSKSWDRRYPVGKALFAFSEADRKDMRNLRGFLATTNQDHIGDITFDHFREIVYQLGMFRKYPAIRTRYIDEGNISQIENELRLLAMKKLHAMVPSYYPGGDEGDEPGLLIPHKLDKDQREIVKFIKFAMHQDDGSQGVPSGLRANFITTNYDNLVEAIIDRIFGPDDISISLTYRGITPLVVNGEENWRPVHNNWIVNDLFKINGGFEIYRHGAGYEIDYGRHEDRAGSQAPQLMLPSKEQDYTQDYFQAVFPKAIRLLQESSALVIVGYSLPDDDSLLRFLIKQFAEDRADGLTRAVFYVGMEPEKLQREKLRSIWPGEDGGPGLTMYTYSGGFAQWAAAVNRTAGRMRLIHMDNA